MSKTKVAGRTLALVVVLELVAGAVIWFSHSPSADAQPSQTTNVPAPPPAADAAAKPATDAKDACPVPAKKPHTKKTFGQVAKDDLLPIGILLAVIVLVLWRLPKVE